MYSNVILLADGVMSISQFVPVESADQGKKAQSPAYILPTTVPAT